MAFPLVRVLPSASGGQRYTAAVAAGRLGMDGSARLYPRGSFCLCPYNETDGKAGLAVCLTDASTDACDLRLVFIPGRRK